MRTVTLYLGPGGAHLSGRVLVTRDVSTVPPTQVDSQSLAGTVSLADVALDFDGTFEATLTDTAVNGTVGQPTTIKFSTYSAAEFQSGALQVVGWDDESESSQSVSSLSSLSTSSLSVSASSLSSSTLSSSSSSKTNSASSLSTQSSSSSSSSSSTLSSSSVSSSSHSSSST